MRFLSRKALYSSKNFHFLLTNALMWQINWDNFLKDLVSHYWEQNVQTLFFLTLWFMISCVTHTHLKSACLLHLHTSTRESTVSENYLWIIWSSVLPLQFLTLDVLLKTSFQSIFTDYTTLHTILAAKKCNVSVVDFYKCWQYVIVAFCSLKAISCCDQQRR